MHGNGARMDWKEGSDRGFCRSEHRDTSGSLLIESTDAAPFRPCHLPRRAVLLDRLRQASSQYPKHPAGRAENAQQDWPLACLGTAGPSACKPVPAGLFIFPVIRACHQAPTCRENRKSGPVQAISRRSGQQRIARKSVAIRELLFDLGESSINSLSLHVQLVCPAA